MKSLLQKNLLTSAALFLSLLSHAQVGVVPLKEYADFKTRTLLVIVEEPLAKVTAKLEPEQLEIYNKEIEDYNNFVKWAMDTYYKVGHSIEYKNRSEAVKILSTDKRKYAYVEYTKFGENYTSKAGFEFVQKNRKAKDQTRLSGALSMGTILSAIEIRMSEDYNILENSQSVAALYRQYLPDPFPDKSEIAYALRQINAVFEFRENGIDHYKAEKLTKEEGKKLQTQKLLVAEGDIAPNVDRDQFLKTYTFPIEIVSYEKIEQSILEGTQSACVLTVPMLNATEDVQFNFVLYDCASGKTIAKSLPQEGSGVSTRTLSALKAMKKAATESKVPQLTKENLMDFNSAVK